VSHSDGDLSGRVQADPTASEAPIDRGTEADGSERPKPPLLPSAVASLVASLLVCPLPLIGGIAGIALGSHAQKKINASRGAYRGQELAVAGIVVGVMQVLFICVGLATALMVYSAKEQIARVLEGPEPTIVGEVTHVVLPSSHPLVAELARQQVLAHKNNQDLLVFVVTDTCVPCRTVIAALPEPEMQAALRGTRWVEVSANEYTPELKSLGVPLERVPGFVLLDRNLRTRDYIHGGEWEAYRPDRMAPVLSDFVEEEYRQRRDPWPGRPREDETAL